MTLDLDELEAAVKAMTPGPWDPGDFEDWDEVHRVGLLTLVNAAPELIRLARCEVRFYRDLMTLCDELKNKAYELERRLTDYWWDKEEAEPGFAPPRSVE